MERQIVICILSLAFVLPTYAASSPQSRLFARGVQKNRKDADENGELKARLALLEQQVAVLSKKPSPPDISAVRNRLDELEVQLNTLGVRVPEQGSVRLQGSNDPFQGRLEIFVLGQWGTVCNDEFDEVEVKIVCNQLGLPSDFAEMVDVDDFGEGEGRIIWLDELECNGNETNLLQCEANPLSANDCSHFEDVAIVCRSQPPSTTLLSPTPSFPPFPPGGSGAIDPPPPPPT